MEIRKPHITGATPQEQITQLVSYLFTLTDVIEYELLVLENKINDKEKNNVN